LAREMRDEGQFAKHSFGFCHSSRAVRLGISGVFAEVLPHMRLLGCYVHSRPLVISASARPTLYETVTRDF
jgi:hypothetical protein